MVRLHQNRPLANDAPLKKGRPSVHATILPRVRGLLSINTHARCALVGLHLLAKRSCETGLGRFGLVKGDGTHPPYPNPTVPGHETYQRRGRGWPRWACQLPEGSSGPPATPDGASQTADWVPHPASNDSARDVPMRAGFEIPIALPHLMHSLREVGKDIHLVTVVPLIVLLYSSESH